MLSLNIKHADKNNQYHCIGRYNKYAMLDEPGINLADGQLFQGIFKLVALVDLNDPLGYPILADGHHHRMVPGKGTAYAAPSPQIRT